MERIAKAAHLGGLFFWRDSFLGIITYVKSRIWRSVEHVPVRHECLWLGRPDMIRKTIVVAASVSFLGAMLTSLMAHADSGEQERWQAHGPLSGPMSDSVSGAVSGTVTSGR